MSILNNFSIGDRIHTWRIMDIIYNHNQTLILNVVLDGISPDKLVKMLNYKTEWIMKIRSDLDESEYYLKNELDKCKYALDIPNEDIFFKGKFKIINEHNKYTTYYWSTYEKYTEDIGKNYIYAKKRWKELLTCVIEFLRYIHKKKIIHGDLKARNILYENGSNIFKVCDYESLMSPNVVDICNKSCYNGFYYYSLGCQKDESYYSYRMDLEAFGYILWAIFLSSDVDEYIFDWQEAAFDLYKKKIKNNSSDVYTNYYKYLDDIKKKSCSSKIFPIIDKYFQIISVIDWKSTDPPDDCIYDQILELKNWFI
jgi:serine/threonine protein kinase